jgi:protein involved in temperature-dependent protein secretion
MMTKREQVRHFMKCYETKLALSEGCEQSYEMAEADWIAENDDRMYKNYHSFRTARYHWLKYSKNNRKVLL